MTEQPCNRTDEERGSALRSSVVRVVHRGDTVTSTGGKSALLNSSLAATTRKLLHGDTVTLEGTWTAPRYNYFNLTGCFLTSRCFLTEVQEFGHFASFCLFVGVSCPILHTK